MNTVVIPGLLGATFGFGLFVAIQAARGELTLGGTTRAAGSFDGVNRRAAIAAVVGVVVWVVTGWPVGTVLAVAAAWWGPGVLADRNAAKAQIERTEAVATWAEQLRDVVSASAGIGEALVATARVAPAAIRPDVEELARRLRRERPATALAHFANAVDDPTADQVVVALQLTMAERGERLSEILSAIAADARAQASSARTIEATRAKLWRQAVNVTATLGGVFAFLVVFQPSYLDAYSRLEGQAMIGFIGLLWGSAVSMMVTLARGHQPARVLNPSAGATAPTGAGVVSA